MRFLRNNKKLGFTLIEVIVYISILSILLVVAVNFLTGLIQVQKKAELHRKVWENADYAAKRVVFEIENAKSIYACPTCSSIFDNDAGAISLETIINTPSGESTTYVDIYLNLADSRLYIKREGLEKDPITSADVEVSKFHLKDIAFDTYNIPTSVQIEIVVKQKGEPKKPQYKAETGIITTASIK